MSASDADLFRTALAWRREGHSVAIATVTSTWGSAPRRQGAHLIIRQDGMFEGSVSGGCVEGEVIAEAASVIEADTPKRLSYGVADAKAWEVGLACGGEIEVLLQPMSARGFPPKLAEEVLAAHEAGRTLVLHTDTSGVTEHKQKAESFARAYPPPLELLLVGAVHISQTLAPLAGLIGYRVKIVDPRGSFAADARFAGVQVDQRWPDEALAEWRPGPASAVVTLTHDPKLDDPALEAALRSDAFYIAALGSRRTHAARLERLTERGFSQADLARIHGPAGLAIGAANPAEIALSVAAEMTQSWRKAEAKTVAETVAETADMAG